MKDPNEKGEDKKKLIYEGYGSDYDSNLIEFNHYLVGDFNNALVDNNGLVTGNNLEHEYSDVGDASSGDFQDERIPNKQLQVHKFFAGARINGKFDSQLINEGEEDEMIECIHVNDGKVRFPTGLVAICENNNDKPIYLDSPDNASSVSLLFFDSKGNQYRTVLTVLKDDGAHGLLGEGCKLKVRLSDNNLVTVANNVNYRNLAHDEKYYKNMVNKIVERLEKPKIFKTLGNKTKRPDKGDGKGGDGAGGVAGLGALKEKIAKVK